MAVVAHHSAIGTRVGQGERHEGDVRLGAFLEEEVDGLGGKQRRVAVDDHDAVETGCAQRLPSHLQGVARAKLLFLHHEARVFACECRVYHVGPMADHRPDPVAENGGQCIHDEAKHRFAKDSLQDLRLVGMHAGAFARCQYESACR